jgi:hypothetical protein
VSRDELEGESGSVAGFFDVQAIVDFAFPRDYLAARIAELFESRHPEGAPDQVAVMVGQRIVGDGGEDDHCEFQGAKPRETAELAVGERERCVQRGDDQMRAKCFEAVMVSGIELARTFLDPEPGFEYGDGPRKRQGQLKGFVFGCPAWSARALFRARSLAGRPI